MYVAEISLAAKIQSDALAKHYLYPVYLLQLKYRVYQFSRARAKASDNAIFNARARARNLVTGGRNLT